MKTCVGLLLGLCIMLTSISVRAEGERTKGASFYSSIRGHVAYYDQFLEIQDNATRVGFEAFYDTPNYMRFYSRVEWQLNLVDNQTQFRAESSTEGNVPRVATTFNDPFRTRLGYLGIDMGRYGDFRVGKQWSVYCDVTGWTDRFNVFGGQASETYPFGTDGGGTGTGRAEKALVYRLPYDRMQLGAQMQLRGRNGRNTIDNFAFSGTYGPLRGASVGAAFNRWKIPAEIGSFLIGSERNGDYATVGVQYESERVSAALVYAHQSSGNAVIAPDTLVGVAFDANGIELYAHYDATEKLRLIGGFNYLDPNDYDTSLVSPDYGQNYLVLGADYFFFEKAFAYYEMKLDFGKDYTGADRFNVFTLGVRIDLDVKHEKRID